MAADFVEEIEIIEEIATEDNCNVDKLLLTKFLGPYPLMEPNY